MDVDGRVNLSDEKTSIGMKFDSDSHSNDELLPGTPVARAQGLLSARHGQRDGSVREGPDRIQSVKRDVYCRRYCLLDPRVGLARVVKNSVRCEFPTKRVV